MALDEAKQQAASSGQVDLLEGSEPPDGRAFRVIVSTVPTELIQTDGAPQYSPIERTQLLYVTNSPNRLFSTCPHNSTTCCWPVAGTVPTRFNKGPGSMSRALGCHPTFALIPDTHPTETVRAAVPGTPQAQEAVIANSVPQVATVSAAPRGSSSLTTGRHSSGPSRGLRWNPLSMHRCQ